MKINEPGKKVMYLTRLHHYEVIKYNRLESIRTVKSNRIQVRVTVLDWFNISLQ